MKTITLYDLNTGALGRVMTLPEKAIAANVPAGFGFKDGQFDRHSQRVDVETGAIVAYERPAAEFEAEQKIARERQARQRIEQLERSQARAIRELVLNSDEKARERLAAIDSEIAELRADL